MKTPMALWKKIYIFLAVTIILALNIFVLVYAVRAEMPSYKRRNDPHYIEAVEVEVNRVMGFREDKENEIIQALPMGLAETGIVMIIPDILIIGLAASIYKTKSYRDAGEDDKARSTRSLRSFLVVQLYSLLLQSEEATCLVISRPPGQLSLR